MCIEEGGAYVRTKDVVTELDRAKVAGPGGNYRANTSTEDFFGLSHIFRIVF